MTRTRVTPTTSLAVLFAVYLALLGWVVLWKLERPWVGVDAQRVLKLVPFLSTADAGASAPAEVAVNVLLFVPFGLYLGLLAPRWPWWKAAGVVAGASLGLEVAQYALAVGSSDVTDVVVNTAGGLVGMGLVALARSGHHASATTVLARVCSIGTVLALITSGLVVASPLRHAPGGGEGVHGLVPREEPSTLGSPPSLLEGP